MSHREERAPTAARVLRVVTIGLAGAIVLGIVWLWPGDVAPPRDAQALRRGDLFEATVDSIEIRTCGLGAGTGGGDDPGAAAEDLPSCRVVTLRLEQGPDRGSTTTIELPDVESTPDLAAGERVILERPPEPIPGVPYGFFDRIRTPSLLWLAVIFAALVVLLGRMRGLAALVGLVVSIAVLLVFVIPAILQGESPVLVASVGAGAIGFAVLYLAHGLGSRTTVALIGTLVGVGITLVLSLIWSPLAHLSGLASESAYVVQAVGVRIDLGGLLLAGIVIGALGAIDDVAVTQASAVWELHEADPQVDARGLFARGMRVGRDHVGSIVNTLVLAYAGASLPLLILFQLSEEPLGRLVGSEVVATEIVRTLVGSIGLVAAMPVTTWLASVVAASEGAPVAAPARVSEDARPA
jgi:uncharacterized membrane protein